MKHADKRRKQVLYREGDLVWIHLHKEHFSAGHFGKLKPRGDGPFRVLKKINDNAYKIEIPSHYNVSATFNVADLSPYKGDSDDEPDSWSSLFQEGEDDADAVKSTSWTVGNVIMYTRSRKKAEAEPAPPARDPHDVETIERLQQRIQELELQQSQSDSPAEEAETKPNIEILEFTGKVHPDDFIDWLSTVERVFDVLDIPDKLKVKPVAINLRQHASLWWDHVNKRRRIKGKSKNMTVEEVINEFDKLRMRYDVVKEEKQLALKVEKQIKAKSNGSTSRFPCRFTLPSRTAPPTAPKAATPTTSDAGNTRERVDNAPRCYKCGGIRYYARDCPNLKTLAFIPNDAGPIYDTDAGPEVDKLGDELVYPDRGEALVIQGVLNVAISKSIDDNSWLRNNIFRTK
ncbi:reverse transcriptase domain-containing protein [Tanacetum coccineum]|uniref:Reverse transcriptase domain-containing protein n=1 Tax=Tanacetum coccineum TaxID=301880 RepID=A0ABQ5ELY6_9ASTR